MFLNNDKGFSLIQGIMLAGLLSGTALVTAQLVSDQKKTAVNVRSKDAIEELADHAYSFLQLQDNCRDTIITNGAAATSGTRNLTHLYAVNKTASDVVQSRQPFYSVGGVYFANTVRIEGMSINYGTVGLHNLTPAVLDIRIRRNDSGNATARTKDGFGGKDFSKKINIIVQRDGAGNFSSCYAVKGNDAATAEAGNHQLLRQFCQNLNPGPPMPVPMFVWNNTTNTCAIQQNTCPGGQFFTGLTSTGIITDLTGIDYTNNHPKQPIGYRYSARNVGLNSVGVARCKAPMEAFDLGLFIDTTLRNCVNRPGVRFYKTSGNRVGITCN